MPLLQSGSLQQLPVIQDLVNARNMLCSLHITPYLVLPKTWWVKYYYLHFTDEKTKEVSKSTWFLHHNLVSEGAGGLPADRLLLPVLFRSDSSSLYTGLPNAGICLLFARVRYEIWVERHRKSIVKSQGD